MIQQLQRPTRLVLALGATCVLLLWLVHLQHTSLHCDLPVVVQHFDAPPPHRGAFPDTPTPAPAPAPALVPATSPASAPSSRPPRRLSRIGKVTVAANGLKAPVISRAIRRHEVNNEMHGYVQFTSENEVVSDLTENDPFHRP